MKPETKQAGHTPGPIQKHLYNWWEFMSDAEKYNYALTIADQRQELLEAAKSALKELLALDAMYECGDIEGEIEVVRNLRAAIAKATEAK